MYQSLEATLHDAFWDAEEGPGELALLRTFHAQHPGRALELGCGSGRLLLPLLASGLAIEGIDLSADMLDRCRKTARGQHLAPVLYEGDIQTLEALELPGPFATITIPAFTAQLVDDPSRLLATIDTCLAPSGWLYLTAFVPSAELEGEVPANEWFLDRELTLPDQSHATVETNHSLDPSTRSLLRRHRYRLTAPDGKLLASHDCTEHIHWLEPHEWIKLLHSNGFRVSKKIANFDPRDDTPLNEATVFTLLAQRR